MRRNLKNINPKKSKSNQKNKTANISLTYLYESSLGYHFLQETVNRVYQNFDSSSIVDYLFLNDQLSFNFLDNFLLKLLHRTFPMLYWLHWDFS